MPLAASWRTLMPETALLDFPRCRWEGRFPARKASPKPLLATVLQGRPARDCVLSYLAVRSITKGTTPAATAIFARQNIVTAVANPAASRARAHRPHAGPSLVALRTRTGSIDRPLELRLRHRRPALDPQSLCLVVELLLRAVASAAGRARGAAAVR